MRSKPGDILQIRRQCSRHAHYGRDSVSGDFALISLDKTQPQPKQFYPVSSTRIMHKPKDSHRDVTWYVGLVLKWYQSRKKQGGEWIMHINLGRFTRYFLVIYGLQKVQCHNSTTITSKRVGDIKQIVKSRRCKEFGHNIFWLQWSYGILTERSKKKIPNASRFLWWC
jgi:hypothetical protein